MKHMLHTTHELKAPFAAIQANIQLLMGGYCGTIPAKAQPIINKIDYRCRRMTKLIREMLQLANLQSFKNEDATVEKIDMKELISWSIDHVRQIALQRDVKIDQDLGPAVTRGIEDHLKILFTNLVANAAYYSHEGGTIRVSCYTKPDGTTVAEIEDQGIGIPEHKMQHVFNDYFRTEEAAKHNRESTGLGLAIVRHVVERHRINLKVKSCYSEGTVFILEFPVNEDEFS